MGKRKKALPVWAQIGLVWVVMSVLLAFGVLYLRATETLSDDVFQPLARVLCNSGDRIATSYELKNQAPRRVAGDSRGIPQSPVWSLQAAQCVGPSGNRQPAPGFVFLVWLPIAAVVGAVLMLGSRGGRVKDRTTRRA